MLIASGCLSKPRTWARLMTLPAGRVEIEEKVASRAESWRLRGQGGSSRRGTWEENAGGALSGKRFQEGEVPRVSRCTESSKMKTERVWAAGVGDLGV